MPIPETFLTELCERNDIVDVVSSYVSLSKRSGQNLFGLCPFHSEKSPSFSVSQSRQIYHCFGCGKGGGVINFVMEMENQSFPEAVEFLAKRVGMTVPVEDYDPKRKQKDRTYEINRAAAKFFHSELYSEDGAVAVDYMFDRRISKQSAVNFGLGFARDSWDNFKNAMKAEGFSEQELFDAGLLRRGKNGGFYDAFRSRLMFPIIDLRGNVIGFSGRILGDGEPKYLNSPETVVFSKAHNLFGLNLAKKSKLPYIILVEGNIDVVALHQAGFDSAVASLGTSLTAEQARLLSRFTDEIIIAYDGDTAGQNAAKRAITLVEKLEMKVRVLVMEDAKDPDEYIVKFGTDAFTALINKSENHIEYQIQRILGKYDLEKDEQRLSFLTETVELVSKLQTATEREVYSMRLASMVNIKTEAVSAEVDRIRKKNNGKERKKEERQILRPSRTVQPRQKAIHYDNIRSARAEEGLIRLLYLVPELVMKREVLREDEFSSKELYSIYISLMERAKRGDDMSMNLLTAYFSREEMDLLVDILQTPENLGNSERALADYIRIIKAEACNTEIDLMALQAKLKEEKGYGG